MGSWAHSNSSIPSLMNPILAAPVLVPTGSCPNLLPVSIGTKGIPDFIAYSLLEQGCSSFVLGVAFALTAGIFSSFCFGSCIESDRLDKRVCVGL